jgi:hypothetical protein
VAPDPGFRYDQPRAVLAIPTYTVYTPVDFREHCRNAALGFAKSTLGANGSRPGQEKEIPQQRE